MAAEEQQGFSLGEQAQGQDAMGGFEDARPPSRQQRPESRAGWATSDDQDDEAGLAVDAQPTGDMDEEEYVSMLNRVLRIVGLHAQVSRFDECAQASVFVAIFERLFQVRLSNVIRNPETYEDRVLNCQRVIDALGGVTSADIAADRICGGDFDAIARLIQVFHDLCQPESSRSASDIATYGEHEREGGEWWGPGQGPFVTGRGGEGSSDEDQVGQLGDQPSTSSSHTDGEDIYTHREPMFRRKSPEESKPRRSADKAQARPSSTPTSGASQQNLQPAGTDTELHERIRRQRKYDARRARDMERVARTKHERTERIASNAALRDRRHQKVWAKQLAQQLQQEIASSEARREAQREQITKKLFKLALRQKRDMDIAAEHAERERRNERRRRDNERFQGWEQWYQDQCDMLDEEKSEEHARHEAWERERQTQLREMERTVRSALIKQMQRIRNDIRENDEQYEAKLGLDGGFEAGTGLRVLGQPGKQWRAQIARIASQLVDAAELNRVVRVR
jgi:hypothetical protein